MVAARSAPASDSSIPRFCNCASRHSRRSRAATPGGSKRWTRASTRSTSAAFDFELRRQLFDRGFEITVLVQVVDDGRADLLIALAQVRHPELPHHVVFEGAPAQRRVFKRAAMVVVGIRRRAFLPVVRVGLEVLAPVELFETVELLDLERGVAGFDLDAGRGLFLARPGLPVVVGGRIALRRRFRAATARRQPGRRLRNPTSRIRKLLRRGFDRAARASDSARVRIARSPRAQAAKAAGS